MKTRLHPEFETSFGEKGMFKLFRSLRPLAILASFSVFLASRVAPADVLVSTYYGSSENAFGFGSVERIDETTGQMTASGQIHDPTLQATGVAQGPDGTIYVSNRSTGQIMHYSISGAPLGVFATLPPNNTITAAPTALHFGPDGNLFVSDSGGSTIQRYDIATGQMLNTIVNGLTSPAGFAFAPNGDLYACDFAGGRIVKVTGNLQNTIDVTPDLQGHSQYNYITANSNPKNGPIVPLQTPEGILLAPNGNLLVSDLLGNQVLTFDSHANLINQSSVPPLIPNQLPPGASGPSNNPGGLALDRNGNTLLAVQGIDFNNSGTVLKYGTNGNYVSTLSSGLPGPSDLTLVNSQATWAYNGGGSFGDGTKWDTMAAPNGVGASAFFTNANTGFAAIYVTGTVTLGSIVFANTGTANYQLLGDGVATHGIKLNNGGIGASINVNSGLQFVSLPITLADSGGTTFYAGPGANLFVTDNIGESGGSRSLNIAGEGSVSLSGVNSYTGGTTVSNGDLVLTAQAGSQVIAPGTTITVSNTASLLLSGTLSDLGSATVNPVKIINNSASPVGVSVAGTNQQVGEIDGTGTTFISAGDDLTVGHLIQGSLVINGAADSHSTVTIAPYSPPLLLAAPSGLSGSIGGSSAPEPPAVVLAIAAACGLFVYVKLNSRRRASYFASKNMRCCHGSLSN
jgi:autotransporter-associated beta strand protein